MSKSHIEWLEEQCTPKKKPTKEEVLKKFEELGYKHKYTNYTVEQLILYKPTKEYIYQIDIYLKERIYYFDFGLTPQEHQLLTELFKALGWFE